MSVYVDEVKPIERSRKWPFVTHAHMMADTPAEFRKMARRLRLEYRWIQFPGTWKEHYDLTGPKHRQAVEAGAVEVSRRDLVRKMQERQKP